MTKKILPLILLLVLVFSSISLGQRRPRYDWDDWDDFDDIAWLNIDSDANPMIELNYGLSEFKQKNFTGDFSDMGLIELKLGYSSTFDLYEEYLIEREDNYFFANYFSSDFASKDPSENQFDNEVWQIGLGKREGFGYDLDLVQIIPYTDNAIVWSRLKKVAFPGSPEITGTDSLSLFHYQADMEILDRYHEAFRFGTQYEAGLRINIGSLVDFSGGYQFGTVFPRYMVWKHIGSFAIETAGLALLDTFINEIMDSSPAAGPLMNTLLKGAYSYGFFLLKKDNMNWPFNTEAPLSYESFKFGVTLTF